MTPTQTIADIFPSEWKHTWQWQTMSVSYVHAPPSSNGSNEAHRSSVILIHGFGANKEHWRHNIKELRRRHDVYALDLIGFGASDKPTSKLSDESHASGWIYGIDAWSQQVVDFIAAHIPGELQLIGNSIGGVVALNTARLLEAEGRPAQQVILIDCAQRALDDKRLNDQPFIRQAGRPALKALVRQRWLTSLLFKAVAQPGVIKKVLQQAYPSGQNVDAQLVELLLQPALQTNAAEAFRGFINLFNDHLATDLLSQLNTPVAMLSGELDPWEPLHEAEQWQRFASVKSLQILKGLGHCPHDEAPNEVNSILLNLINNAEQA